MEIPEKKNVEEAMEKQQGQRKWKRRTNKRGDTIVFGLPESKAAESKHRKEEEIKGTIDLSKTICQVNITEEAISKAIRLGKLNKE